MRFTADGGDHDSEPRRWDGRAATARQSPPADFPRLEVILGDNKYHDKQLTVWLWNERPGWRIDVQSPPLGTKGFHVIAKRWVVERTNAWNGRSRRRNKDY